MEMAIAGVIYLKLAFLGKFQLVQLLVSQLGASNILLGASNILLWTVMNSYEQLWTVMDSYEQLWAVMNSYELLWPVMNSYE